MGLEHKKAIYDTVFALNMVRSIANGRCSKLRLLVQDIIIAEDDPYYFIQAGEFVPKSQRKATEHEPPVGEEVSHFVDSLVPSFLRVDTQGRVIRFDTFSKVCLSLLRRPNRHRRLPPRRSRRGCGSGGLRAAPCSQSDWNASARRRRRTRADSARRS